MDIAVSKWDNAFDSRETNKAQERTEAVTAKGVQQRDSLKGPKALDHVGTPVFPVETYASSHAFTVDGIPLLFGESLSEYHARALAWITVTAATEPANNRFLSRWQFVARLIIIPATLCLLIVTATHAY